MKRIALLLAGAVALFASPAAAADVPATPDNFEVMLVIDTSGSMRGHAIEVAVDAATSFVAQMPAGVRIGVESFGREIKVLSAPTVDRASVTQQLAALTADGDTPLHDAVITATRSFTPAAKYKAMVLLSDGGDSGSLASLDDAVATISGVHVEAVSLTTHKTNLSELQRLGTVTSADDPNALPAILKRIGALLIPATVKQAPAPETTTSTTPPAPTSTTSAPATVAPTTLPATRAVSHPAPPPRHASRAGIWIGAGMVFVALSGVVLLAFVARD
jgi:hypothetical protein